VPQEKVENVDSTEGKGDVTEGQSKKDIIVEKLLTKQFGKTEEIVKALVDKQGVQDDQEEAEVEEQDEEAVLGPEELEDEVCLEFLTQFIITSEAAFVDAVDIILMLKAIPLQISKLQIKNYGMF